MGKPVGTFADPGYAVNPSVSDAFRSAPVRNEYLASAAGIAGPRLAPRRFPRGHLHAQHENFREHERTPDNR